MKKLDKKALYFFLFLILSLVYIYYISAIKNVFNKKEGKKSNIYLKGDKVKKKEKLYNKYKNKKRLINSEENDTPEEDDFIPLNIYLDLYNFNYTYPNETLLQYKEYFYEAMYNAKSLLEKFVKISTNTQISESSYEAQYRDEWGLEYWNNDFFEVYLNLSAHNYYILFRFDTAIKTVASSYICDEYNAPSIGVITINPEKIKEKSMTLENLKYLMLQQFIHLLGFQIDNLEFTNEIVKEEDGTYSISEDDCPNFFAYAQKYFNCDKIDKIVFELDEENNLRWPSRQFLGEIMANSDYPEEKVLSGFTLAYLEDLGYFKFDKKLTGGLFKFGKNKGCKFFFGDCGRNLEEDSDYEDNSVNNDIVFSNEFYLPITYSSNIEPSCSSGRLSKTIYQLHEIREEDEGRNYEYNLNNYIGVKETNYCPIAEFINDINIYTGSCSDINIEIDNSYYEELGQNSFCVLSSIINSNEYKAVCHKMICSLQSLTIKIGDYYIVCPRSGGKIKPEHFNGYILCPDYNLICSGTFLCNNISDCINQDSEEKETAFNYTDYTIKTTQNSSSYKNDPIITDYLGELEHNGTCPYLCLQCDVNNKCIKCAPHYKIYNEEENECHEIVPNCLVYTDDDICNDCIEGYSLVKEYNNSFVCISDSIIEQNYYFKSEGNNYYLRCNNTIKDCEKCSEEMVCTHCMNNYEVIDDGEKCGDINLKMYYKDNTDNKYKSCSKYNLMPNCYECDYNGIDNFNCLKCIDEYVFAHSENEEISCVKESTLTGNKYFKKDENNYYQCDIYNKVENCDTCSTEDECISCKDGYDIVNGNKLCLLTSDIQAKKYYIDTNNYYYPCSNSLDSCSNCDTKTKCNTCINNNYVIEENDKCIDKTLVDENYYYLNDENENNKYSSCSKIPNCEKCISSSECTLCIEGFKLIEDENNIISCQNIDITSYYEITTSEKKYYRKCDKDLPNCELCSNSEACNKCKDNFAIIGNDFTKCENLLTKKYYYDDELNQYKECSYRFPYCDKCIIDNENNFICEQCITDYAFKHDNSVECSEKLNLETNLNYFTNNSGIDYYSCNNPLYHDVVNCLQCTEKSKCTNCQPGLNLVNNGQRCISQNDVDNHIIFFDQETLIYTPCSELINLCHTCSDESTCTSCEDDAALEINDKCVSNELIQNNNYYLDETTTKYVSCSIIDNCLTCTSGTVCTSYNEGYALTEEKKRQKIDGRNGGGNLSSGGIVGIVFGCLGFLLIAAGIIYYLLKRMKKQNMYQDDLNVYPEEKIDKKEEKNEQENEEIPDTDKIQVKNKKRSIHNENNANNDIKIEDV